MQIDFIIMKEHLVFGKKLLNQKLSKHYNLENCKFLTTYFNLQKKALILSVFAFVAACESILFLHFKRSGESAMLFIW